MARGTLFTLEHLLELLSEDCDAELDVYHNQALGFVTYGLIAYKTSINSKVSGLLSSLHLISLLHLKNVIF